MDRGSHDAYQIFHLIRIFMQIVQLIGPSQVPIVYVLPSTCPHSLISHVSNPREYLIRVVFN